MGFKNFRLQIALRVAALAATMATSAFFFFKQNLVVSPIILMLLVLAQILYLIHYMERSNRELVHFLNSIRYSDFTHSFNTQGKGTSFDALGEAFNQVVQEFQKLRAEKESHFFYLQNIVQHIGITIVAYRKDGTIEMLNNAGKRMFRISSIKNIAELRNWSTAFVDLLFGLKAGDNTLVKIQDTDELLQLAVYATEFIVNDRTITLISLKNIQAELEQQELEAWQKLIRVLTHEIMNSIAPISSLSATAGSIVELIATELESSKHAYDHEMLDDVKTAIATIEKRSQGLIHFVDTYRNLTKIPKPNFTIFPAISLATHVHNLLRDDFIQQNIDFELIVEPPSIQLTADEALLVQVILNLIKNAIQALDTTTNPRIKLKFFVNSRGRNVIQ
ncbi:MAG: hypothetical protein RIS47_82, partial [Bacteroidota bacterium]